MIKRTIIAVALVMLLPATGICAKGDIVIKAHGESRNKAGVGPVIFPHDAHKKLYKCAACHPKIFKPELGANQITMKLNMNRQFCGSPNCHNSPKAFPLFHCNKCHQKSGAGK